jgi:ribosome maturation factor RimP
MDNMTNDLIAKAAIDRRMAEIITPVIEDLGYELVRVRLMTGKNTILQIMADKPEGGIEVDDCAKISTAVGATLDVEDPISSAYTLEVSSGGLSRPLTTFDDYECFKGSKVKVTLKEAYLGNRSHKGFLHGIDKEGLIVLETEDHEMKINFSEIEKSNIDLNWAIQNQNIKLK